MIDLHSEKYVRSDLRQRPDGKKYMRVVFPVDTLEGTADVVSVVRHKQALCLYSPIYSLKPYCYVVLTSG